MWHTSTAYIGEQLRKQGLLLEEEGDAAGFLGVAMERNEGGSVELKQRFLVDRILEALGLDSKMATGKYTPAKTSPLTKNEDGPASEGSFSYSSVVGRVCCCTCPDTVVLALPML